MELYEAMSMELSAAQDHIFTVGQRSAAEREAIEQIRVVLTEAQVRRARSPFPAPVPT